MNFYILFLSIYFLLTGFLEYLFSEKANHLYERWIQLPQFRYFSLWAFAVGFVAYLGSPTLHLKWFVIFVIWIYGFMGLWIFINPKSFILTCRKAYFDASHDHRLSMVRLDGVLRLCVAGLLFYAAK